MKIELREEVRKFAEGMEQKLRANDHKPGWQNDNIDDLMDRISEELMELKIALLQIKDNNYSDAIKETYDIGNFAMMVCDICSKRMNE